MTDRIPLTIKKTVFSLLAGVLAVSTAACSAANTTAATGIPGAAGATPAARTATVTRGDLGVIVSVDGNLVMPEAFNLHFGAPGDVKDVLVTEGDKVKAGAILAKLDDTSQRLEVKSAVNSMQSTLANLYETVPRLPQFPTRFWDAFTYTDPITGKFVTHYVEKLRWDYNWISLYDPLETDPNEATYYLDYGYWQHDHNIPENAGLPVGYPGYYANSTALAAYNWAIEEVTTAQALLLSENYTAAANELYVAISDLESSLKILEDASLNPMSGLGNTEPFVPTDEQGYMAFNIEQEGDFNVYFINEIRQAMASVRECQGEIESLRKLIDEGKKQEAEALFGAVLDRISKLGTVVMNNINIIKTDGNTEVYGRDISIYLYNAASDKLDAALNGIETGGLRSDNLTNNLRVAEHYMMLCNGILGSNELVLQHGLSLKAENEYKISLEKNMISLSDKKDDFLKTVIMTPVDGVVVSVDVKKNDVLSSQDYSSKGTIQVVDTSQIKFEGTVDEIDIMKIKPGQTATISVDALENKKFTGKVLFISPYGVTSGSVIKFDVTILLDPTDVDLMGGLTATADISVTSVKDVLLVPLTAVTTTGNTTTVTYLDPATGKTEVRKVTIGGQSTQFIQIVSGLKEGDKVVLVEKADIVTNSRMGPSGGPPSGGGGPR